MQRVIRIAIVSLLVVVTLSQRAALAQESKTNCREIKYSERVTDARLYRLDRVEGQAVFGAVSEKGEFTQAAGLCIALFNKKDKRLVASVSTDNRGLFQLQRVEPGEYVLIVSVSELHDIIVLVKVADSASTKAGSSRLLLHLRLKEDRVKSFVTAVTNPALRDELLKREETDQAIRNQMIREGAGQINKVTEARMASVDADNTVRMKEVFKKYGWPGPKLVGRDGADAAFMLVQHSPELSFQKAMLPLVRAAYQAGELSAWNYALLLDRVLVREGKPQVYGMHVNHWSDKEPVFDPIEDEANVDKRRAEIGLSPLSEYRETLKRMYFPQSQNKP